MSTPWRVVSLRSKADHPSLPVLVAHATDPTVTEGTVASDPVDVNPAGGRGHLCDTSASLRCQLHNRIEWVLGVNINDLLAHVTKDVALAEELRLITGNQLC